jgi:hypothetical protein
MFHQRTLFILGAEASAEVGLPIGKGLVTDIAKRCDIVFEQGQTPVGTGDISGGNKRQLDRKHLPPHFRVSPRRMLQRCPTLSAHRAPRLHARHARRRVGAPANDEGHKRDSYSVPAGVAAQP